ncbi:unnamed protein product [Parascedosporium putredinis]|uniref:DUF6594 domain-containing protein n=1 Tax=Parascedosporium putredinis TaxID=1442378 RepID=A0A9P1H0U4_9PEZI|nr:unnamed protein product [Parascedosporium putredinis]CAI7992432.1 unnamed protein product [Parascedosporium putredinis]
MMSRQRPAKWRVQNLRTWLQNNHRAISDNEVDFLDQIYEEELLGIADKNRSRLATWLDSFFIWLSKKDRYDWFKRSEPDMDAIHKETVFTSDDDKSLESFSTNSKLGIITAFILSFIVLLWMATTAGPLRVLAGAAAYSAVLVAFLQPAERPGPPPS